LVGIIGAIGERRCSWEVAESGRQVRQMRQMLRRMRFGDKDQGQVVSCKKYLGCKIKIEGQAGPITCQRAQVGAAKMVKRKIKSDVTNVTTKCICNICNY
jgi:hypothetical protein